VKSSKRGSFVNEFVAQISITMYLNNFAPESEYAFGNAYRRVLVCLVLYGRTYGDDDHKLIV